jgi:hypothetical protein
LLNNIILSKHYIEIIGTVLVSSVYNKTIRKKQLLIMKKTVQLLLITLVLFSCSNSDDDCTTTMEVPKFYELDGRSHTYIVSEEVSCDFDIDSMTPEQIEPVILENLSYELLQYQHAIDQTDNYEKLRFTIRLPIQTHTKWKVLQKLLGIKIQHLNFISMVQIIIPQDVHLLQRIQVACLNMILKGQFLQIDNL